MGLVKFFNTRIKQLRTLKNSISSLRKEWHKRKPSIFKRKIDFSESLNNSYKYSDGNVIYEKILRLIEDTGIDIRRSLTTDLMFDNDVFEDNYNIYNKTNFIYLAPGFKTKKFQTNNLEDLLWKSGIVKEIFSGQFGDFEVPDVIVNYTAQARRDGRIPDKSLPLSKDLLDKGKKYYKMLSDETGLNKQSLYSMMGALWSEMAWAFENKTAQINTQERDAGKDDAKIENGHSVKGTKGNSGCGEGWFGLTFWNQKTVIISELKKLKAAGKISDPAIDNITNTEAGYGANGTMLVNCSDETWCKIIEIYLRKCQPKLGKILTNNDADLEELLYASFLWKAGNFGEGVNLSSVDKTAKKYIETHEKQNKGNNPGYKAKNAFAQQIYTGIMLALYMYTGEVPELENIDKEIGV